MCDKLDEAKKTMSEVIQFVEDGDKFKELFNHVKELSLLDMLWDNIPIAMFYKDTENRLIKVNRKFSAICGIPKVELEGKHADDLSGKEISDKYARNDIDVIRTGKPKLDIIEPMLSYENKMFRTDKYPVIIDNKVIGVLGVSVELPINEI